VYIHSYTQFKKNIFLRGFTHASVHASTFM